MMMNKTVVLLGKMKVLTSTSRKWHSIHITIDWCDYWLWGTSSYDPVVGRVLNTHSGAISDIKEIVNAQKDMTNGN